MSDRYLLEMASYAAGIKAEWLCPFDEVDDHADDLARTEGLWLMGERSPDNDRYWNPLRKDADAFRLAVSLHMVVAIMRPDPVNGKEGFTAVYTFWCEARADEIHGDDPNAATRRAIVSVAAAIGEAMP